MSKKEKKDDTEKAATTFDLEAALLTVNRYLLPGFREYIRDEKISTERQFNKFYNDYKELR